jgi:hypothetical protein
VLSDERMMRIAVAFAKATTAPAARLCTACIDVLEVSGAGITVMGGDIAGPLCVSNDRMAVLEDLQFTTGEGPCQDAFHTRTPVSASDLELGAAGRWPAFVDLAIASGIGAVFAFPLSSRGATVGVLTLYQDIAGALSQTQHENSVAVAEVLTETVLGLQEAEIDGQLAPALDGAVAYRAQIHQASGMVAIQLQVSAQEALTRIRAYAFANDLAVESVAADIVGRRLRLTDDRRTAPGG